MPKTVEGHLKADGLKFDLIVTRFNSFITEQLLSGALDALRRHGVSDDDLRIIRIPGSWELPFTTMRVAKTTTSDAIICLGCVIQGSTDHHNYINSEMAKGISSAAIENDIPVTFGVLTTGSIEQAIERAGTKLGNKGADAAMAAIEMANLSRQLDVAES
jgi:6,7-dimethyl-8-ribityllumazine synthase